MLDPQKKVLYVAAYDAATGRDAVLEVDPLNPSGHLVGSEASLTRVGFLGGTAHHVHDDEHPKIHCGSAGAFAATRRLLCVIDVLRDRAPESPGPL